MRISVSHRTLYSYDVPARSITQVLRLTPRSHAGQHVSSWRIRIDVDGRLRPREDASGNLTHLLEVEGPITRMAVDVVGEVVTADTSGIIRDMPDTLPPQVFLRETDLTTPDEAIRDLAADAARGIAGNLDKAHALNAAVNTAMVFELGSTAVITTASQAFAQKRGVCQDLSHVLVAAARVVDLPARYVSGYFRRTDTNDQDAGHAWAEIFIDGLGWVGFDPAHAVSPGEAYVRVAAALDYLGAAPVRGSRSGGFGEHLDVTLRVANAVRQSRN